ncbi:hypothetical protein Ocin01_07129 [Orchesella cincta]|uniref:CHK kinase-like domain-containing protein n=1 Tax=Orchesella cincta TaxID=48709 RepID=A0A1D2N3C2_ORCCI|nr:hypothetical protein Ocin01_07129 [Orchesella cincta]
MSSDSFINEEFLQRLLGCKIKSYTCNVGTKPGDNYLSTIYSVKVVLCDDSLKSILVKCYPENVAKREFLDNTSIFSTEYLIYDQFLPALNQLVDTCGDDKSTFAVNVASFYGGNIIGIKSTRFDAEPWISENFIVLEDLRTKGYKMLDRRKGLDLDHVLLTIKQLANLHALSWVYKRRNGLHLLVNKYPYLKDVMYKKENEAGWKPVLEGLNRNALEIIQQEFGPESDIFLKLKALLSKDVMDMIRIYLNGTGIDELVAESLLRIKPDGPIPFADDQWLVATHGDSWINNLLFAYNEEKTPKSVVIVDHQTFRETCLTVDLAYLIYSSTPVSLRKQSVPVLLRTYFDHFVEICQKLNEKPPVSFTFSNFERRWRRARIYGLLMSINFITFIHKPDEPEHTQKQLK